MSLMMAIRKRYSMLDTGYWMQEVGICILYWEFRSLSTQMKQIMIFFIEYQASSIELARKKFLSRS